VLQWLGERFLSRGNFHSQRGQFEGESLIPRVRLIGLLQKAVTFSPKGFFTLPELMNLTV